MTRRSKTTKARPRRKAARDLERTYSRAQFVAKLEFQLRWETPAPEDVRGERR